MKRRRPPPLPLSGTSSNSGATALSQIALYSGVYIANTQVARRLGKQLDLTCELEQDNIDTCLRPLVLGGSLDFALKRLGIALEAWDVPINRDYRDQLSDACMFAHKHLQQGHPVLMLMQSQPAISPNARHLKETSNTDVKPLCWVLVDSSINTRDGSICLSLHNTFDDTVHERSSTSMRLPSLHKYTATTEGNTGNTGNTSNTNNTNNTNNTDNTDNTDNTNENSNNIIDSHMSQQHVTKVTIPRSIPITMRAITGTISPFVGNDTKNPLQDVYCRLIPATDDKNSNDLSSQLQVTVSLPSHQLNKSHTLYLFDDSKHVPTRLEDYYGCNCIEQWDFTCIFEDTWNTTTSVPLTGCAIFKCVETRIDPKIVKRTKAHTLRKEAQQYLSITKTSRASSPNTNNNNHNNKRLKKIKDGLKPIVRPIDSRGPGSPKRSPQKLPKLQEVECLPDFMQPRVLHQGGFQTQLFINERQKIKREPAAIRVFVHIGDEEFVINCGAGNQNIKWLALAAGQRYQTAKKGRSFKLPGHIVGTEVSTTKIIVQSNNSHDNPAKNFMSTNINVDKWETTVSASPVKRKQNNSGQRRNAHKKLMQLKTRVREPSSPISSPISSPTLSPKRAKVPDSVFGKQKESAGRGFTPDKGPEHRAKQNKKAEKKAVNAAEARFKTLQLLANKGQHKKRGTRNAKRKLLGKLLKPKLKKTKNIIKTETHAASKIQAIQRGRLRRRKLKNMNKAASSLQAAFRGSKTRKKLVDREKGGDVFASIAKKRKQKRKQSIIDSVMNETKKKQQEKDTSLKIATFGQGLGSNPNPFVSIRELLSDESHCWLDLASTTVDGGDNPLVTMWMDKAYYSSKNAERGARLLKAENTVASGQAAYWASIMAQEKIKDAQKLLEKMDSQLNALAPDLLFNVAQLVRKFSPRLILFFQNYLQLLRVSEDDRIRAKNAMSDLKLALGLVGPNSSDAIPSEAKVEEAFVLTIEAMKVASNLCPEAVEGMPSLDDVGQPDFNALDLLKDSKKLHDLMHKICTVEWSSMDEGTAFGIAAQVEEIKETVIDVTAAGVRKSKKVLGWAEAAGKVMGTRFGALNKVINTMLEAEADERASMSEFEKLWEKTGVDVLIEKHIETNTVTLDQSKSNEIYKQITGISRQGFFHSKNVFQYYAVIGGGVFDVSFSELMLFLKHSGAYDDKCEMTINDIQNCFAQTLKNRQKDANNIAGDNECDLIGWLAVMVRISLIRYGDLFNDQWGRALQHFIDMHMIPMGHEVTGDEATMKVALRSPEVINMMQKYAPVLKDVFIEYANDEGELEMEHYVQLVTDAGLIDADLTRLECRRSFVRAQIAASHEMEENGYQVDEEVTELNGQDQSMDLDEFIVSLPRLGCDKWDEGVNGKLPVYIKQERISAALALLDPLNEVERRKKNRRGRQRM